MAWPALGAAAPYIISGIGSIAGGLLGNSGNKGGNVDRDFQREALQSGVSWRVQDARNAGISPLAAMGASINQPQPVYADGKDYSFLERAGQSIGSAIQTKEQKTQTALAIKIQEENLKGMQLENVGRQLEIEKLKSTPAAPTYDQEAGIVPGQADAAKYVAPQIPTSQKTGVSSGTRPMRDQYVDIDGTVIRPPGEQLSEAMEDNPMLRWRIQFNDTLNLMKAQYGAYYFRHPKAVKFLLKTRPRNLGKGYEARWSPNTASWVRVKIGKEGSKLFTQDWKKPAKGSKEYLKFSGDAGF